jgi:hypothetical protein
MAQVTYLEQALNIVETLRGDLIYKFRDVKVKDTKCIKKIRQFNMNCHDMITRKPHDADELLNRVIDDYIETAQLSAEQYGRMKQADEAVEACLAQINEIVDEFEADLMKHGYMNPDKTPTPQADINIAMSSSSLSRNRKAHVYPQNRPKRNEPRISLKQRQHQLDTEGISDP